MDLGSFHDLIDTIAAQGSGLVMTMRKGGVGKTTVAAGVAVALVDRGHRVHLTTTDPAAHIADAIGAEVDGLDVDRIDPVAETRRTQPKYSPLQAWTSTTEPALC